MSHLGSKILYHVLNSREDTACERVYAPWPDMERALRKADLPLCSLETKRPLASFDIVGFSLLYEMCYTNILAMLDLAGIPLRAAQRGADAPLIVCGGPCACNPEPLAPFMDAVMIGDGEELIGKLVDAQRAARAAGEDKHGLLRRLAGIDGMYIPSFYAPSPGGRTAPVEPCAPERPVRCVLRDLAHAPFVGRPVVPYLNVVHDRACVEVMRGCTRGLPLLPGGVHLPARARAYAGDAAAAGAGADRLHRVRRGVAAEPEHGRLFRRAPPRAADHRQHGRKARLRLAPVAAHRLAAQAGP